MIQEEQLKLKEMRENLGDVKTQPQPTRITSEEVPSGSPDSLPCPSPAGSVESKRVHCHTVLIIKTMHHARTVLLEKLEK